MGSARKYEVAGEQICWHCNTSDFRFECTDELVPPQGLIGQDRALKAIEFGLEVDKRGYNLFVTGLTGTGKASAIKRHLQRIIDDRKDQGAEFPIFDWCYVHNFDEPDMPKMLRLPPGHGKRAHEGMGELLRTLREELPKAFSNEDYTAERKQVEEEGRTSYQRRLQELEKEVRVENFGLQLSPAGVNLLPLTEDGKPLAPEDFMQLPEEEKAAIEEKRGRLLQQVQDTLEALRIIKKEAMDRVKGLDRRVGEVRLSDIFHKLMDDCKEIPGLNEHLASLKEYTLNNLNLFTGDGSQQPVTPAQGGPQLPSTTQRDPFLPFEINVLVDNSSTKAAPIVIESNPTWGNLFGRIERRAFMGAYFSDHTMLKAGSIHHSNGGYLVLNVRDLLMNSGVWEGLKRAIRDKQTGLEDPAAQFGVIAPQGLRPQPMSWDAKVIVTGDEATYRLLSTYDREDFWEMFKVKAEFGACPIDQRSGSGYC